MAILELFAYSLPLTAPLELADVTLGRRDGLLLRLTTDEGTEGWGDVAPLPGFSRETLEEARGQCKQLAGIGGGEAALDYDALLPSVRFGFEAALLDAQARKEESPLHRHLNAAARSAVETNALLTGSPEEILRDIRRLKNSAFAAVKLKLGRRPLDEGVTLVHRVADLLPPETSLLLDANRAWTVEEALEFAEKTTDVEVAYVEEPLKNPAELKALSPHMPIALDETLTELSSEEDLRRFSFARGIVLKPTLLGGVTAARALAIEAMKLDMKVAVSATYESGIGLRGLLGMAASFPYAIAGFGTYRRFAYDVIEPRLDLGGPVLDADALLAQRPALQYDRLEQILS